MRLISNHELQQRSESELSALFRTVSEGLVRTSRGSPERRNALASLENIGRARAFVMSARQPQEDGPPAPAVTAPARAGLRMSRSRFRSQTAPDQVPAIMIFRAYDPTGSKMTARPASGLSSAPGHSARENT
jgi:hypothetical protein